MKKTLRHMELQKLVMEDALETPITEVLSDEESAPEKRSREGSVCVRTTASSPDSMKKRLPQSGSVGDMLLSLSSRSLVSGEEDSDSNSVVYNKTQSRTSSQVPDPMVSPSEPADEEKEPKVIQEDETPTIPIDFTEDFTTLFKSKSSKDLSQPSGEQSEVPVKPDLTSEVMEEKKGVSMSARILGVWNRKTEEEKKKEKKESKLNKFLPIGKGKKEGAEAEENMTNIPEVKSDRVKVEKEEPVGGDVTQDGEVTGNSKKTKWEIDQSKGNDRI